MLASRAALISPAAAAAATARPSGLLPVRPARRRPADQACRCQRRGMAEEDRDGQERRVRAQRKGNAEDERPVSPRVTQLAAASCAALAALTITLSSASTAQAFVPVQGCSDPGSFYDTGVGSSLEPSGGSGSSTRATKLGTGGCAKMYQPARAAEVRAVAALQTGTRTACGGAGAPTSK